MVLASSQGGATAIREAELTAFLEAMEMHKDKKCHVHCAANMRVTAFLGLYDVIKRIKTERMPFHQ